MHPFCGFCWRGTCTFSACDYELVLTFGFEFVIRRSLYVACFNKCSRNVAVRLWFRWLWTSYRFICNNDSFPTQDARSRTCGNLSFLPLGFDYIMGKSGGRIWVAKIFDVISMFCIEFYVYSVRYCCAWSCYFTSARVLKYISDARLIVKMGYSSDSISSYRKFNHQRVVFEVIWCDEYSNKGIWNTHLV
jgi:hypothetical protein